MLPNSLANLQIQLDISSKALKTQYKLNPWDLGPFLQGALMERIDKDYAACLHEQPFNPYSQYCVASDDHLVWSITGMDDDANNNIIKPLLLACENSLFLKSLQLRLDTRVVNLLCLKRIELTDIFYGKAQLGTKNTITIRLDTPVAFKSKGRYVFYPDIRLLFQNLSMRYSALYEGNKEPDTELLDLLENNIAITSYQLLSQYYPLSGNKIPAFMGRFTIKLTGAGSLCNYARMLVGFGEYSGMGIKTSMGMGAMYIESLH